MSVALRLGLVHAATDLATITAMVRATGLHADAPGAVLAWFLVYDVLAFGGQPIIGLVVDRVRPGPVVLAGLTVTAAGVAVATAGGAPSSGVGILVVLLAALGNAVTHVGAGAAVLRRDLTRAAPAGLLVAPGALGLALGLWFGREPGLGPTWWVAIPLLAAAVLAWRLGRSGRLDASTPGHLRGSGERLTPVPAAAAAAVAGTLLLTSVAIRSLVGGAATRGYGPGLSLTLGIPLAAFAGKALGGLLADRVGWLRTTVVALAVSVPLLTVEHESAALLLAGLLVFQTTMPVTLVAVGRLLPARPATAFGLPCAALLAGSLPASFAWGAPMCARPLLGAWVAASALVAWGGLRSAGLRWERLAPDDTADAVVRAQVTR